MFHEYISKAVICEVGASDMTNGKIQHWKEKMNYLEKIIFDEQKFSESISLLSDLHSRVHSSEMISYGEETIDDILWKGMDDLCFRTLLAGEKVSIAWNIYHIARIEDMTMNLLVSNGDQVYIEGKWSKRINCPISDTGNSLTTEEILNLSVQLDMHELRNYRTMVGRRTNTIIRELQFTDLNRGIQKSDLQRIFDEGGVKEDSRWLLDFWGSRGVAGLLYMPANFHNLHHISESIRLKENYFKESKDHVG